MKPEKEVAYRFTKECQYFQELEDSSYLTLSLVSSLPERISFLLGIRTIYPPGPANNLFPQKFGQMRNVFFSRIRFRAKRERVSDV